MAATHPIETRTEMADFVVGALDGGTLVFQTAGNAEVATLVFGSPAFSPAVNGVAMATPITPDPSATGGTIAKARLKIAGGVDRVICTVSGPGGGGDIILNSVTITAGQQVSLSTLTYTAPP